MGSLPTGHVCKHLGPQPTPACPRWKSVTPVHRGISVSNAVAGVPVDEVSLNETELNQAIREGHYENSLVERQVQKLVSSGDSGCCCCGNVNGIRVIWMQIWM